MPDPRQRITFGEMRASGVRGVLIYCSDFRCSRSVAISGDRWPRKFNMPKIATILACSLVASVFSFGAQARDFCGQGFHRGPSGACVDNGVPTRLVVTPNEGPVWPRVWCPKYGDYYNDRYGRCVPAR